MRSTPLIPCRRHGKKRKEDEVQVSEDPSNSNSTTAAGSTIPGTTVNAAGIILYIPIRHFQERNI